jgi:hypothetical protein
MSPKGLLLPAEGVAAGAVVSPVALVIVVEADSFEPLDKHGLCSALSRQNPSLLVLIDPTLELAPRA